MLGITLALLCALTWSLSVILLKLAGARVSPVALNLGKNLLGLGLLIPTTLLIEGTIPAIKPDHWWILIISGFFGIGVADAMSLKAISLLEASKIAILECLFAPFVISLSLIFLGESLKLADFIGIGFIGISLGIILPKRRGSEQSSLLGVGLMAAALLVMAGGIVMIKPLFDYVPLFWLITIRMAAGVVSSLIIWGIQKDAGRQFQSLMISEGRLILFSACIFSAYISIIFWVSGYKYLQASIASVLNQTSTVFTVILASLILKEPFTFKILMASVIALIGVAVISGSGHY